MLELPQFNTRMLVSGCWLDICLLKYLDLLAGTQNILFIKHVLISTLGFAQTYLVGKYSMHQKPV